MHLYNQSIFLPIYPTNLSFYPSNPSYLSIQSIFSPNLSLDVLLYSQTISNQHFSESRGLNPLNLSNHNLPRPILYPPFNWEISNKAVAGREGVRWRGRGCINRRHIIIPHKLLPPPPILIISPSFFTSPPFSTPCILPSPFPLLLLFFPLLHGSILLLFNFPSFLRSPSFSTSLPLPQNIIICHSLAILLQK